MSSNFHFLAFVLGAIYVVVFGITAGPKRLAAIEAYIDIDFLVMLDMVDDVADSFFGSDLLHTPAALFLLKEKTKPKFFARFGLNCGKMNVFVDLFAFGGKVREMQSHRRPIRCSPQMTPLRSTMLSSSCCSFTCCQPSWVATSFFCRWQWRSRQTDTSLLTCLSWRGGRL